MGERSQRSQTSKGGEKDFSLWGRGKGPKGRAGGLNPGEGPAATPPEGPEVDQDVGCRAGGRRGRKACPELKQAETDEK